MSNSFLVSGLGSNAISLEAAAYRYEEDEDTITFRESGLSEDEFALLDENNTGSIKMSDYMNYLGQLVDPPSETPDAQETTHNVPRINTKFV